MEEYKKPPLSFTAQLNLLKTRGLKIENFNKSLNFISHVNYYRFSPYCIPFEKSRHIFKENITFKMIINLYNFDKNLRFIIDEVLEAVEISFRTKIAYHLSHKYGAFVHENKYNFNSTFYDYEKWLEKIHDETNRAKEKFISHYRKKYLYFPKLPIWMVVEIMSFGSLSLLFKNLRDKDKIEISKNYKIHSSVLPSWLHTFSYIRNICAHHCRLWNRDLAIKFKVPKNPDWTKLNNKKVFVLILSIIYLLNSINKEVMKNTQEKITNLIDNNNYINNHLFLLGFPSNWKDLLYLDH
ncbi:Abi family protein [Candidatus Dependentiae bacterium]|nr:Abi family protein [Candidatus Dependentiae bacterium]